MAATWQNPENCTLSGGSKTATWAIPATAGRVLVVAYAARDSAPSGIGSAGWTARFFRVGEVIDGKGYDWMAVYSKTAVGGETSLVVTGPADLGIAHAHKIELVGVSEASYVDGGIFNAPEFDPSLSTNPVTPGPGPSAFLGGFFVHGDGGSPAPAMVAGAGWTDLGNSGTSSHPVTLLEGKVVVAPFGTYAPDGDATPTGNNVWRSVAFAFSELAPAGLVPSSPQLIVEYFDNDPVTFGPSTLQGVIHDAVKVGWSWYSRFPANAFFTLRQDSIHNARLHPLLTHIRINYFNPATGYRAIVFTGRLGEPDESGEDVVWTAWNYMAELSLSRTGYRVMYPVKLIGSEIALPEWTLARTADSALLNFVTTGTIEDPLGSDAVTPIRTDSRFGVIDVPRLLLMFDLTEIGRANTANNVTFAITRAGPPFAFTFLKNAGVPHAGTRLTFPGFIHDFRHVPGYASLRNDLATIGTSAAGGAVEIIATDEANADIYGRRQDVFTIKTLAGLAGAATETDAQTAITQRAVKEAVSLSKALELRMRPGVFEPFDGWDIEDAIRVEIYRGRTAIDATYRIVGARGRKDAQGYHPQLIVQLPTVA